MHVVPMCHFFYQCYASADHPAQCIPQSEDYLECLHHTKEVSQSEMAVVHQYPIDTVSF